MNVTVKENTLVINGVVIKLNGHIKKIIEVNKKVLALINAVNLTVDSHPPHNNNILCFDENGNELWVIDNPMPNVSSSGTHVGLLDQWIYLGRGREWGRELDAITVQSGNWVCNINLEDGSLYNCEPFK